MTDKELIKQLSDPKTRRRAFEQMVGMYSEQLYWKIRRIVLRHEDADDVLQNSFIKVWKRLDDFRGDSALSTWLYRICVNESLDFLRRKRESLSLDDDASVARSLYADEFFNGTEVEIKLQKAIETLPEAQRATFLLRYYDDMPYKEMSQVLGTSEAGLKTNYHLAVKKIKQFMEEND